MKPSLFRKDRAATDGKLPLSLPSERMARLLLGVKTALAASLCLWISDRLGLQEGYWAAISAIIVMQSNVGSTARASRDRLFGTAVGAVLGWAASPWGNYPLAFALTLLAGMLICALLRRKNSVRLAGVTICIVMLAHAGGSNWRIAIDRFFEVSLGILVALAVSVLVLPQRARRQLRQGLAEKFLLLGQLLETVMNNYRASLHVDPMPLKKRVESTLRSNEALLKAVDNELATGGVSTEGLTLLAEAGESLHDAILALELAVHESEGDRFAARIEPELSDLAGALVRGFLDVGDSIRKWEFRAFPPGIDLPVRLRALDARVAEIRPTGIGFPIEEILRICAVQLHLKRIASELQLLRTQAIRQVSPEERWEEGG
jgi:uncharacterized membrane protein YccC